MATRRGFFGQLFGAAAAASLVKAEPAQLPKIAKTHQQEAMDRFDATWSELQKVGGAPIVTSCSFVDHRFQAFRLPMNCRLSPAPTSIPDGSEPYNG